MDSLNAFSTDALKRPVPRYTSYPTAPHFGPQVGAEAYRRWLGDLQPGAPVSLYLHLPFCQTLCWFCACRTQGTKKYAPVTRYLDDLIAEIAHVAEALPGASPVTQMHWGGGSPSMLMPEDIALLAEAVSAAFPGLADAAFDIELDPRDLDAEKMDALADAGVTRISVGVQDFAEPVQRAIGRMQGATLTAEVIGEMRARGIGSVGVDLVYGLPLQTEQSLASTIEAVVALDPDRLALFGYAHVPWLSKRQKLIDAATLPRAEERRVQAARARRMLLEAGYQPVGIDHFAKPGDALAKAARNRHLRRNFQGYTTDDAAALLAFGASAIGRMPQGYVQNQEITAQYQGLIRDRGVATARGVALGLEDRLRADAIEQLLCYFELDIGKLQARYGDLARPVERDVKNLLAMAPPESLLPLRDRLGFAIAPEWTEHTRLIAAHFDAYLSEGHRHSLAL
ncbi:MAG: oxygen-independent coproporphyrinogen III oxidase [Pseudomonadota bacterium]